MRIYETIFIVRQDATEQQSEALFDKFSKILEDKGAKIARRESWGLKTLAYKIQKNKKGHYHLINYEAPSEAVEEMERQMRLSTEVIRYMSLRWHELPKEPSIRKRYNDEKESRSNTSDSAEIKSSDEKSEENASETVN